MIAPYTIHEQRQNRPQIPPRRWHPRTKPRHRKRPRNASATMNSNERSTSRNRSGKPKSGNSSSSGNNRIIDKAPAMFSAAQLRVFLRALVNIDPYTFDDVAEHLAASDENNEQTSEEILLSTIDGLPDDKLTGFALRLVLTPHTPISREGELDVLTEAEAAFAPPHPKKTAAKKAKTPTPIKAAQKTAAKKTAKKQVAA